MIDKRKILKRSIIVAPIVLEALMLVLAFAFVNRQNRGDYLYPHVNIAPRIVGVLIVLLGFAAIYAIFIGAFQFKSRVAIVAVSLLLLFAFLVSWFLFYLVLAPIWYSHTTDADDFLIVDEKAEKILSGCFGDELLAFENPTVNEYDYFFDVGFDYYELKINFNVTLSEAEFADWVNKTEKNENTVCESEDGVTRIVYTPQGLIRYETASCVAYCNTTDFTVTLELSYIYGS